MLLPLGDREKRVEERERRERREAGRGAGEVETVTFLSIV